MSGKLGINDLTFLTEIPDGEIETISGGSIVSKWVEDAGKKLDNFVTPLVEEAAPCAVGAIFGGIAGCLAVDYVVNRSGSSSSGREIER